MTDDVLRFISRFSSSGENKEVVKLFTCGCCYWFAMILYVRYIRIDAEIMYDSIENHFGTKIIDRVYDITGDVTEKYIWDPWSSFDDDIEKERIERDCINF